MLETGAAIGAMKPASLPNGIPFTVLPEGWQLVALAQVLGAMLSGTDADLVKKSLRDTLIECMDATEKRARHQAALRQRGEHP